MGSHGSQVPGSPLFFLLLLVLPLTPFGVGSLQRCDPGWTALHALGLGSRSLQEPKDGNLARQWYKRGQACSQYFDLYFNLEK